MSASYNFRNQYFIFVFVTTLSLIVAGIVANKYIHLNNDKNIENSTLAVSISDSVDSLHVHIDKANKVLNLFLLSPSKLYRQQFLIELKLASKNIDNISNHQWIIDNTLKQEINDLQKNIHSFSNISKKLMDIRFKNTAVFPAITIAEQKMVGIQANIIDNINLALHEIRETKPIDIELYSDLVNMKDKWRRLVLAFRLYFIYQMGSLNEDVSISTIKNIELYKNDISNMINTTFFQYELNDNLGFESETAIANMKPLLQKWFDAYEEIKLIQIKGQWRIDVLMVLNDINPINHEIYYNLNQIELALNNFISSNIKQQETMSDSMQNFLWLIVMLFISILSIIYFAIDKTLLKPISNLTQNIENEKYINSTQFEVSSKATEINKFLTVFTGMKKQIKLREEKLEYMALHDGLTSLPNRSLLFDRINVAINNYQRYKEMFALFMLDLNKFKLVNDTLGHNIGDQVLIQVASRLKSILRKTDSVARIGGDEFSILMLNIDQKSINDLATKINTKIAEAIYIDGQKILIGTSIGIAIFPTHGFNNEMLMQKADLAMYYSKTHNTAFTIYYEKLSDNPDTKPTSINSK